MAHWMILQGSKTAAHLKLDNRGVHVVFLFGAEKFLYDLLGSGRHICRWIDSKSAKIIFLDWLAHKWTDRVWIVIKTCFEYARTGSSVNYYQTTPGGMDGTSGREL
jgi:hypothetical protein